MARIPLKLDRQRAEVQAHKLSAPSSYAGAIPRQGILSKVFATTVPRLVLLHAPAGHGKSTTLQQLKALCDERGYQTAWYVLDEADNDARRFSVHFQALMASLTGDSAADGFAGEEFATETVSVGRYDWVLDRLFRVGRPVAVFLDDFQFLTNKSILGFCRKLFERLPDNVRFFIASRSLPEIGLSRLLVGNRALILRAEDLRFSFQEVERFFEVHKDTNVTNAEIESIYCRTEGWPAALQLFKLSLASPSVRSSLEDVSACPPRELTDYLADSVLSLQPPDLQDFLLRTSLLTRLTAPLCDAVTGRTDSQHVLKELERSGLFVRALDAQRRWFTYHPLFSSFLIEQLINRSRFIGLEVHRTAARWHMSQGNFEETLHHAIECKDFALAVEALNIWSSRLIADAQLATVERWFVRLPFGEVAKHLDLSIKTAYALVFLRRKQKAQPLLQFLANHRAGGSVAGTTNPDIVLAMAAVSVDDLESAFAIIERVSVCNCSPEGFSAFELGAAANLTSYRAMTLGNFEEAREYLAFASAYNERGSATFSRGYTLAVTGVMQILSGELNNALARYREDMAEQELHLAESFALAALASCYLWALYEANELELVQAVFGQYHDIIAESALPDFLVVAYLSAGRAHEALGQSIQATEILDELESICYRNGWSRLIGSVNWERARRSLVVGAIDQAQAIAAHFASKEEGRHGRWLPFSEDMEGASLGRIRLAIHAGNFDAASRALNAEFERQPARVRRRIKLHALDALLRSRMGMREASSRALRGALQLAEPGRYVRVFVEEGPALHRLLQDEYQALAAAHMPREAKAESQQQFLRVLLQAAGIDVAQAVESSPMPSCEALTSREKQILRYLANGVSNREMAERIFVSENTVKFHLKNIYSKLQVNTRVQALSAARLMGLIG